VPAMAAEASTIRGPEQHEESIMRVRLRNPHNLCYMNAGTIAMVHALQGTDVPRGLQLLQDIVLGAQDTEITLSTHFGLRNLFAGWSLDNRQRDAAEFTQYVLNKAGYVPVFWEERVMGRGVHKVTDAGGGMLFMDLPNCQCDLQELVSAWSDQVRFHQQVRLPIFTSGVDCHWEDFHAVAGLVHYGNSPDSGHYRSVLRAEGSWWLTDDPSPTQGTRSRSLERMADQLDVAMEQEEELRIWQAFKQAPPTETTGAAEDALDKDRSAKLHKPEGKGDSKGPEATGSEGGGKGDVEDKDDKDQGQGHQGSHGRGQGSKGYGQQGRGGGGNGGGGYNQRYRDQGQWGSGKWGNWKKEEEDELGSPGSLVPSLFAAKTAWQKLRDESREKVRRPMRNILFSCLVKEMHDRLTLLRNDAQRRTSMEKLGWLKGEDFQRLRWDPKLKRNVKDEETSVISYEDVLTVLQSMMQRSNTVEALLRFHPTSPLAEQMQEGTVAFLLQFSLHNESGLQLCADMTQLCHCGSTMVCGIEIKKERSSRSQLANQISRLLGYM
ncbi:unnamed protein product, partial [Symbiodinium sp. CCMP2456]